MKAFKYIYLLLVFFTHQCLIAQNQTNNWYFGLGAGLNFTQNSVLPLTDGQTTHFEGTATMSDSCGNLLFYTDGSTVWNRLHDTLSNGQNLNGSGTTSQSSIIIPKPSSDNLMYIFTADAQGGVNGLNYSIVDIDLNNGLGEIITKNVPLVTPICEKLTSVYHKNGKDVWVVVHHYGSNAFYSYLVDSTGVNPNPVISYSGNQVNIEPLGTSAIGCMKISPKGNRLALATGYFSELFDFNDSTGVVSNAQVLENNTIYNYGVEFSPSGEILYMCGGGIYQYDLNASNIPASRYTVHPFAGTYGLQLGPDRKIYSAENTGTFLNVINTPNHLGASCHFQKGVIDLNGKQSKIGLPNFIQSLFKPDFTVTNLCFNDSAEFNLYGIEFDSLLWNFNDPQTGIDSVSTLSNPKHVFSSPGSYQVSLTTYLNGNPTYFSNNINIQEIVNLGNDTVLCEGEVLIITLNNSGSYLWQDGSMLNSYQIDASGMYWVEYTTGSCCVFYDTISVAYQEPININIIGNNIICNGTNSTLEIVNDSNYQVEWNSGATENSIQILNEGIYWVEVTKNKCKTREEIIVLHSDELCEVELIIPNVYTPNSDGFNDLFTPIVSKGITSLKTHIYNRWGQLIFESDFSNIGWDGRTNTGALVPDGTYYCIVKYSDFRGKEFTIKKFITLLR